VAVNVSARQCLDFGLIPLLEEAIQQANVAPALLTLEITETAAMRDVDHVVALLRQVRALGIGVAVDDFGTGYTSLAYLKRFPLTQIKVDQSFVRDVARDHDSAAIVAAIIAMAHSLGLPVVAEGVEDAAQRDFLISHHCDLAQGYFYSTVLSAEGAASCLRAR
ncbi:MAG: EAL domain-containing protein, partial [Pseudomonadota bacterium]|nr:EAL domain-containing protein [Pseudomonadota bacterium]